MGLSLKSQTGIRTQLKKNLSCLFLSKTCPLSVRLKGTKSEYEGRVEIYHDAKWGTVCDQRWGIEEGNVVCRQLGFVKAAQVFTGAAFGPGTGQIWLTKLGCSGNESSLMDCRNAKANLGNTGCAHDRDAGVKCNETRIGK